MTRTRKKGEHQKRIFYTEDPERRQEQKSGFVRTNEVAVPSCEATGRVPMEETCAYFSALNPNYKRGVCERTCAFRNFRGKER